MELVSQLAALEDRARVARRSAGKACSRNVAAAQAGLAKQTVSGWFSKIAPRVPKDHDEVWKLVELYSRWAGEIPERQYWNNLVDGARPAPRPRRAPLGRLVAEWDPLSLEVHEAVDVGAGAAGLGQLPAYVARPHDAELVAVVSAALRGSSALAVLVGGSSTGKTRACWEAVRSLPPPWRIWHPIDPGRPEAVIEALNHGIGAHTVVWLNEIQFYLSPVAGERVAAGLREVLRDPAVGPVLVLGTVWQEDWWRLTAYPAPGQPDPHAQARELLSGNEITVPDSFDDEALSALRALAPSDPRLAAVGLQRRVTQFLSGAPRLVERYVNAPRAAKAVLQAAVDLRRYDYGPLIPKDLLRGASAECFDADEFDVLPDDWFERALEIVCAPSRGLPGPLIRVRQRPGDSASDEAVFRVADFVEQYARRERMHKFPTERFFRAVFRLVDDPESLHLIGRKLGAAGRTFLEAQFHRRALSLGHARSAWNLAGSLEMAKDLAGTLEVLELGAAEGDESSMDYLVEFLANQREFDLVEELCRSEFGRGNARPLVEANEGFRWNGARNEYSEMVIRIIMPDNSATEGYQARLQLFRAASELSMARRRDSIASLQKYVDEDDGSLRAAVDAIESRVSRHEDVGDRGAAEVELVGALNAELVGVEKLAAFYSRQGEDEKADAVEQFGVDASGAPAQPWGLADLTW